MESELVGCFSPLFLFRKSTQNVSILRVFWITETKGEAGANKPDAAFF